MATAEQKIKEWHEWIEKYEFDPKLGFLISPDHIPSFDMQPLNAILSKLSDLNETKEILEAVNNLPKFDYPLKSYKDKMILRDALTYIVHSYVSVARKSGIRDEEMIIPESIAKPLVQISRDLKIKYGMTAAVSYNWYINNKQADLEDLKIDDIRLRYYFTNNEQHERYFFGATVIGAYFMGKIHQLIFEINTFIEYSPEKEEEIMKRLHKIAFYFDKIIRENNVLATKLDQQYFYFTLRPFVGSYKGVTFKNVADGMDEQITTTGGNGGYDPSYQAFESAFDIKFEGELGNVQKGLRQGMSEKNLDLIHYLKENSNIREYCKQTPRLKKSFNVVIKKYVTFLKAHSSLIENFILKFVPKQQHKQTLGSGGVTISKMIHRHKIVQAQILE